MLVLRYILITLDLRNKTVMITGASSGIGEVTAMQFAALGAKLIVTSDQEERINAVARKLKVIGTDVTAVVADFSKPEQVSGLIERIELVNGPIDILVNNAGVGMHALIDERPMSDVRFLFEVNFLAMANLCTQLLPLMAERGGGRIINISSAAGQFGSAYLPFRQADESGGSRGVWLLHHRFEHARNLRVLNRSLHA